MIAYLVGFGAFLVIGVPVALALASPRSSISG